MDRLTLRGVAWLPTPERLLGTYAGWQWHLAYQYEGRDDQDAKRRFDWGRERIQFARGQPNLPLGPADRCSAARPRPSLSSWSGAGTPDGTCSMRSQEGEPEPPP